MWTRRCWTTPPHAARAILAREAFEQESWHQWVNEASAPPVPGAVGYLAAASRAGIRVFYVTNRHHHLEEATRRNLANVGFPVAADEDVVLTRDERPEWTRDKTSRREYVAGRYRVLQLAGDDLHDFVAVPEGATVEDRLGLAESHIERWGVTWFQLPNPIYGSWERAVTPDGKTILESPLAETYRMLDTDEPPPPERR